MPAWSPLPTHWNIIVSQLDIGWAPRPRVHLLWREALERMRDLSLETQARLLAATLGAPGFYEGDEATTRVEALRELANQSGMEIARWGVGYFDTQSLLLAGQFDDARALYSKMPNSDDSMGLRKLLPQLGVRVHLAVGDLVAAREVADGWLSESRDAHDGFGEGNASGLAAGIELLRCDLDEYRRLEGDAESAATWFWSYLRSNAALTFMKDMDEALRLMPDANVAVALDSQLVQIAAIRSGVLWRSGNVAAAEQEWDQFDSSFLGLMPNGLARLMTVSILDQAGPVVAGDALREYVRDSVLPPGSPATSMVATSLAPSSFQRVLSTWELAFGATERARARLSEALAWSTSEGCDIEAGRCHQAIAELAKLEGEPSKATSHLDAAGELFAKHGATFYLDQVIAKKEILKA